MTKFHRTAFCALILSAVRAVAVAAEGTPPALSSEHASIRIDEKGFIMSITSRQSQREYSPAGHPSPLLSLHEDGQPNDQLLTPVSATFHSERNEIELKYLNGATVIVKAEERDTYFRFQLGSFTARGKVDNVVWGPLHTTVSKINCRNRNGCIGKTYTDCTLASRPFHNLKFA